MTFIALVSNSYHSIFHGRMSLNLGMTFISVVTVAYRNKVLPEWAEVLKSGIIFVHGLKLVFNTPDRRSLGENFSTFPQSLFNCKSIIR